MADTPDKRARELRARIADAKLERLKNSGNGLFDPMPSQRAKVAEDTAVYNKLQNLREEEAEAMEQRAAQPPADAGVYWDKARKMYSNTPPQKPGAANGLKKGGSVKGWGKARGARAAKVY